LDRGQNAKMKQKSCGWFFASDSSVQPQWLLLTSFVLIVAHVQIAAASWW
jgi:hypothetical protein